MIAYSFKEILEIQEVVDTLTGCGYDYDLKSLISSMVEKYPHDDLKSQKESLIEYLSICPNMISQGEYTQMGIDALIFNTPLEDLPMYINCDGEEILKQIVSKWRLKLGK